MKKPFLLILGCNYYPEAYTGDWKGCFETVEEIWEKVTVNRRSILFQRGKKKGQIEREYEKYLFEGSEYDWIEIVDLRKWTV